MPEVIKELKEEEKTFEEQAPVKNINNMFGVESNVSSFDGIPNSVNISNHDNTGNNHISRKGPQIQKSVMVEDTRVLVTAENKQFLKLMTRLNQYDIKSLETFLFYGADTNTVTFDTNKTLIKIFNMKIKLKAFRDMIQSNSSSSGNSQRNNGNVPNTQGSLNQTNPGVARVK
jgi:hypothetical protein